MSTRAARALECALYLLAVVGLVLALAGGLH